MRLGAGGHGDAPEPRGQHLGPGRTQGTAETIAVTQALGLNPERVLEALEGGALDLPYFRMKAKLMIAEDFPARSRSPLAAKDARLVAPAADRHGADLPLAAAIAERFAQATEAGHGDEGMAATYRLSRSR